VFARQNAFCIINAVGGRAVISWRRLRLSGFTLMEVVVASGIFVALVGFVVMLQTGGGRAVNQMTWHSAINNQGHLMEKYFIRAFEKSSSPSLVTTKGVTVSTNPDHLIIAPSGKIVSTPVTGEKIILSIPQATASMEKNPGKIVWQDFFLETSDNGLAKLKMREVSANYNEITFNSVSKPKNKGTVVTLLEDVEKIELQLPTTQTVEISIKATYPKNRNLSQLFSIKAFSQIQVVIAS